MFYIHPSVTLKKFLLTYLKNTEFQFIEKQLFPYSVLNDPANLTRKLDSIKYEDFYDELHSDNILNRDYRDYSKLRHLDKMTEIEALNKLELSQRPIQGRMELLQQKVAPLRGRGAYKAYFFRANGNAKIAKPFVTCWNFTPNMTRSLCKD